MRTFRSSSRILLHVEKIARSGWMFLILLKENVHVWVTYGTSEGSCYILFGCLLDQLNIVAEVDKRRL